MCETTKYDPNADFTYRNILMDMLIERGISLSQTLELVAPMHGKTHEEKEQIAKELIPLVESGMYDQTPKIFYNHSYWAARHDLYEKNNLCFETLRPLVIKALQFFALDQDTTDDILGAICTEESQTAFFHWICDLHFVPSADDCLKKAREITSGK